MTTWRVPGVLPVVLGRQIGLRAEGAIRRRHLYRLRRTGHLDPHAPLGALTGQRFEARGGNAVEVLVDGQAAFDVMARAIAGARRTVHLTGLHAAPGFAMVRDVHPYVTLAGLLADAGARGVRSRILLWDGARVPLVRPTRADASTAAAAVNALAGVRCVLDSREYPLNCHHEKVLVIDDEVAFVGGLDITDAGSDRWDTPSHRPRPGEGWHDVALRVSGPVVADLGHHFAQRWHEVAGEPLPRHVVPAPTGDVTARLVRTIPERVYRFCPSGDFGVLTAYLDALRSAERLIYLENQFLWAVEVVDVLVDKLRRPPRDDFRLIIVLPARPHNGQDATLGQLSRLVEADDGGGRLLALTVQPLAAGRRVHMHAKVAVVDDRWVTIGSANLNSHSLFNDTELNLVLDSPDLARDTRERLWAEHVGPQAVGADPIAFIDAVIGPLARDQAARRAQGLEPTARLRLLEDVSRRTALLLGPLNSLVLDV